MASLNSYADIQRDWTLLLDAAARSPEIAAGIETERLFVQQALTDVQSLKARQDELTALRQEVTQQLREAVKRGKDAAIQLRAVVKAKFGPRTERLVQFDMTPIRKRARKKVEKPSDGEEPVVKAASPPVNPN
jgi:hypothetical protein